MKIPRVPPLSEVRFGKIWNIIFIFSFVTKYIPLLWWEKPQKESASLVLNLKAYIEEESSEVLSLKHVENMKKYVKNKKI